MGTPEINESLRGGERRLDARFCYQPCVSDKKRLDDQPHSRGLAVSNHGHVLGYQRIGDCSQPIQVNGFERQLNLAHVSLQIEPEIGRHVGGFRIDVRRPRKNAALPEEVRELLFQ